MLRHFILTILFSTNLFAIELDERNHIQIIHNDPEVINNNHISNFDNISRIEADIRTSDDKPIFFHVYQNINVPPKAVLFSVYGGGTYQNLHTKNSIEHTLAEKGIIVIVLNMVDVSKRKKGKIPSQAAYSEKILNTVKESIKVARETIPNIEALKIPQNLPVFLTGASFGGQLTGLIATDSQLHNIFDGYITQAASIDSSKHDFRYKTPSSFAREIEVSTNKIELESFSSKHLDVLDGLKNLSKPMLIMHGLYDPNVHSLNSIKLAKEIINIGKSNLLHLHIEKFSQHGPPKKWHKYDFYTNEMYHFMTDGYKAPSTIQEEHLTILSNLAKNKILEFTHFKKTVPIFTQKALEFYNLSHKNPNDKNEWKKNYLPILKEMLIKSLLLKDFKEFVANQMHASPVPEVSSPNAEAFVIYFSRLLEGKKPKDCLGTYLLKSDKNCNIDCIHPFVKHLLPDKHMCFSNKIHGANACQKIIIDWLISYFSENHLNNCKKANFIAALMNTINSFIQSDTPEKTIENLITRMGSYLTVDEDLEELSLESLNKAIRQTEPVVEEID